MIIIGKEISLEEMPQGCIIGQEGKTIRISFPDDAFILIQSLLKMVQIQHPRRYKNLLNKVLINDTVSRKLMK